MSEFKSWDQYVTEADQPPFELPVGKGKVIKIKSPTGEQVLEAQEMGADGNVRDQLRVICGDAYDELMPLIQKAPGGVIGPLIKDIMEHFNYNVGEAPASAS